MSTALRESKTWFNRAACRGTDWSIFITLGDGDDEPPYPTLTALAYCDRCPVRKECLDYALECDAYGVWGGMTSYQRKQLKRPRPRVCCPGCGARDLISDHVHEVCLACGMSWRTVHVA